MNARRAVIAGEEELGRQRWCGACGEWWPDDEEFFGVTICRDGYRRSWCRACRLSQWATTAHGRAYNVSVGASGTHHMQRPGSCLLQSSPVVAASRGARAYEQG